MSSDDKKFDPKSSGDVSPVTSHGGMNHSDNSRNDSDYRRYIFLILFIVVATTLAIILIVNSSFIDRTPDVLVQEQPDETVTEIRDLKADLDKVINDLDEAESKADLQADHVEEEVAEEKPVPAAVLAAPVAVVPVAVESETVKSEMIKTETIKPEPNKTASKKVAVPVVQAPPVVAVSEQLETPQETVKPVEMKVEIKTETTRPAYIKYDSKGNELSDSDQQWTCVEDTRNGLSWEVKSKNDAMRQPDYLYSWFDPDNKGLKGVADGGRCKGGVDCDTNSYVQAMNDRNYCGHNDWRLPTKEELLTLINLENTAAATIDKEYFPETMPSWYWTSSENKQRKELAWYVLFRNGHALNDLKERAKHIRLVRKTNIVVSSN